MAFDLAVDRGNRVRREIDSAVELKPVDRLDQADRADLHEILELLTVAGVLARQPPDEGEVLLDEARTRSEVAVPVVRAEQPTNGRVPGSRGALRSPARRSDWPSALRPAGHPGCCPDCGCDGHRLPPD